MCRHLDPRRAPRHQHQPRAHTLSNAAQRLRCVPRRTQGAGAGAGAGLWGGLEYSTAQYSSVQCSAVVHCTVKPVVVLLLQPASTPLSLTTHGPARACVASRLARQHVRVREAWETSLGMHRGWVRCSFTVVRHNTVHHSQFSLRRSTIHTVHRRALLLYSARPRTEGTTRFPLDTAQ